MDIWHENLLTIGECVFKEMVGLNLALRHAEINRDSGGGEVFREGEDCLHAF